MTTTHFEGWAEQVRSARKGKLLFIDLYMGGGPGCKMQVVIEGSVEDIKELGITRHSALKVKGKVVESQGSEQDFEVKVDPVDVTVVGRCDVDTYPLSKTELPIDYLRSIPMWRGRTRTFRAVDLISHLVTQAIHKYYEFKGYLCVDAPLITKSDCEGAGEAFKVVAEGCPDFFGTDGDQPTQAYLTVSGQLQGEVMASSLGPIYVYGETFRAEKSRTSRHLASFKMMEPEIPFATLATLVKQCPDLLKFITGWVLERGKSSLEILDQRSPGLIDKLEKFIEDEPVVMTYTQAIKKLIDSGVEFKEKPVWGIDLGSEHETWLCGDKLTILTDYPKEIKAFYMYETPVEDLEDPTRPTVACLDVLLPGIGEVIGGSQRESRLEIMGPKMEKLGLGGEEYDFYRDIRKFGYAGSSGFGLGVARMVRFVTGMEQIRDVIPFPVAYGKIHT